MNTNDRFELRQLSQPSLQRRAPLLAVLLIPIALTAQADGEGEHGVLHISGSLTENACRLDMSTAHQSVQMDNISTAALRQPGDQSAPVRVQLRLLDCLRSPSYQRDKLGNLTWSASMPSVSVNFTAAQDIVDPTLVRTSGVRGMGLRLMDQEYRHVGLGQRGQPLLLEPGLEQLTYYIAAERTVEPLQAGAFTALVMFRLNYE